MTIKTEPRRGPRAGLRDGRDARWEAHRTKRRRQLVEAALKAIRRHGAGVGMDEIAAQAGTSKTVLYRHLGDKAGLYGAVVEAVDETVLGDLGAASQHGPDVLTRIGAMVHSYLSLVERDPEIYRFVMTRPLETTEGDPDDPVHRITDRVSEQLTGAIHDHLTETGRSDEAALLAPAWGHGIVGLVRATADHFLTSPTSVSVDDATHAVIELIRPALAGESPS
ncbi:TetR/AcrR family transcriptional regulator [Serinicoccus kebangsaanensis]|uniref:TetR/AcrR family transcriptional regulator n=1 Tax=Serinicoccus kebangsaanensis TaxID=2602069 RepID=UPI00124D1CCB|nr:TetR/AcrR family transcriptional regulator [Serinicoccus kebangsaanensis]